MEQLSAADASMLYIETPRTPNVIVAVMIYDPSTAPGGEVDFDTLLEWVRGRLHLAKAFRRKLRRVPLGLDHPYWVDDRDFDLEYHVRETAIPPPGTWRLLWDQIARIGARPLDLSRPPWEIYVVRGLDGIDGVPEGAFAILLKLHHAAVDGKAGVAMIEALQTHEPITSSPPEEWHQEDPPSTRALLERAGYHALGRPFGLLRFAGSTPGRMWRLRRVLQSDHQHPPFWVPRTRFNHSVSPHRSADAITIALEDLKRCRNALPGASVNDAVLAIVGGGLRRYLEAKGELPEQSLVAIMPISVRRPDDEAGGNLFAMANVSLHTDIADPLARLAAVRKSTADAKAIQQAVPAQALSDVSEYLPGALIGLAFRAVAGLSDLGSRHSGANTIVTNVPGPRTPLYLAGAQCIAEYGMAPFNHGIGLIHAVGSYVGMFGLSFTADREMMPDPEFYAECLDKAFAELLGATDGPEPRVSGNQ